MLAKIIPEQLFPGIVFVQPISNRKLLICGVVDNRIIFIDICEHSVLLNLTMDHFADFYRSYYYEIF